MLVTGAAGGIGTRLAHALSRYYRIVGMDRTGRQADIPLLHVDLADQDTIEAALRDFVDRWGLRIASVGPGPPPKPWYAKSTAASLRRRYLPR